MTPNSNLAEIFYNAPSPQVSSSCSVFTCSEVIVLTDKQTNKQTLLKTSNVLGYATTLGIVTYWDRLSRTSFIIGGIGMHCYVLWCGSRYTASVRPSVCPFCSPVLDHNNEVQRLEQFADIVYIFLDCKNDQNLKISDKITSWFLTSMFHAKGGLSDIWGLAPRPCLTPPLGLYPVSPALFDVFSSQWRDHECSFGSSIATNYTRFRDGSLPVRPI